MAASMLESSERASNAVNCFASILSMRPYFPYGMHPTLNFAGACATGACATGAGAICVSSYPSHHLTISLNNIP